MPSESALRLPSAPVAMAEDLEREFEALMCEASTLAFRVAFSVLRRREDAEDIAQEAFIRAHRSFRQLRDRTRFRSWLVRMTFRLALNHRRSTSRRALREVVSDVEVPESRGADVAQVEERSVRLWAAIDALPEQQRVAIVLAAIEGHDLKTVAALLDVPEGTVKSRLFAARRRLKEMLRWMTPETR